VPTAIRRLRLHLLASALCLAGAGLGASMASAAAKAPPPTAAPSAVPAPVVREGFVLRPVFSSSQGKTWSAGTAFALDMGGQILVVTAFDLFGPNGGLETQIDAAALPAFVTGVVVHDAWTAHSVGKTTGVVRIPDAHPMKGDLSGDVSAFLFPKPELLQIPGGTSAPVAPGNLATVPVKEKDRVWLAAPLVGGAADSSRTFGATVLQVNDKGLFYRFDDASLNLAGTPGAPILNAAGEVVGMQLGGGAAPEGLIGAACPLSALKAHLQAGLAGAAP
jgi:hypothetical protein